jgi:hypothetical protein
MNKEERKDEALKLKGDHKLYLCIEKDCPEGDIYNAAEVADLEDCIEPKHEGDMWIIPDHTPDWLYSIIELYGGCELMESVFEFDSKETIKELAEICDTVIEDAGI